MTIRIVPATERPLREHPSFDGIHAVWPEFGLHDPIVNRYWDDLYARAAEFQFYLLDEDADRVLAEGNAVPVAWDGTVQPRGIDWAIPQVRRAGSPTTLCALQVMVRREAHGRGYSRLMLETMVALARDHGLDGLIAPVRPTLKHRYPLTPIDRYAGWRRPDGLLLDPWLRTHERLGAEVLGIAPTSMTVPGTVAQWEAWAGLEFPESGEYVVDGALVPVRIDRERDEGLYVEPNVWMRHPLSSD